MLDLIKKTGYWRVEIRPTLFEKERIKHLSDCWQAVEASQVSLRGWSFPEINSDYEPKGGPDWIETGFNGQHEKDYWRLYQSGQFIYYSAFSEDYTEVPWASSRYGSSGGKPTRYFLIILSLYLFTEIFEFAARLASRDVLSSEAVVSIRLSGTQDRDLVYWDIGRHFLRQRYTCKQDEIVKERQLSVEDLTTDPAGLALDTARYVFERFNWLDPPMELLAEEQAKLLERRL